MVTHLEIHLILYQHVHLTDLEFQQEIHQVWYLLQWSEVYLLQHNLPQSLSVSAKNPYLQPSLLLD